ncbi:MAG: beta-ketoacyl synthase chain length factor, partial [Alphaproteobacteria bacterium]
MAVLGIGVIGPGLNLWPGSRPILSGESPFVETKVEFADAEVLNPRERRRASPSVRLALAVAQAAVAESGLNAADLPIVFGSSNGEGLMTHKLMEQLSTPDMLVSPTTFHNSVHNAPSGYWSIGAGSVHAATSITAHDFTFGAVLLKAAVQIAAERRPVLIAVYDDPLPEPLHSERPMGCIFAASMVLAPTGHERAIAEIALAHGNGEAAAATPPRLAALRGIWRENPAARAIPLL